MQVFLIHGAYGSPEENWFPWLKEELQSMGHLVIAPSFPTPDGQELDKWMNIFANFIDGFNSETVLVGHSLGPAFILNVLELLDVKIKACFFVAGFIGFLGDSIDSINSSFVDKEFNWEKIRSNCEKFVMFNSSNDPYVSVSKANELAEKLGIAPIIVKNAGHFNDKSGFKAFPQLLAEMKKVLQ